MPVWPPPSPPCAIRRRRRAAPPSAACFSAPIVGTQTTPRVLQLRDQLRRRARGCSRRRARRGARSRRRSARRPARPSGSSRRRGGSVSAFTRTIAASISSGRDRRRGEEAEGAGVAGGGGQLGRRDPAHAGLHDRPAAAEQIAEARVEGRGHGARPALRARAAPSGSITSRIRRSSSAVGARVSGTRRRRRRARSRSASTHLVDATRPGARRRGASSGPACRSRRRRGSRSRGACRGSGCAAAPSAAARS